MPRVYLWAIPFALIFLLAIGAAWVVSENQVLLDTQRTLNLQLDDLGWRLEERTQGLVGVAKWISAQPDFATAVLARDESKLRPYFEPPLKAGNIESLTIADTAGTVLLRLSRNEPPSKGDNVLGQPGVLGALTGRTVRGIGKDSSGRLRAAAMYPVYEHEGGAIIGVLITDAYVDDSSLRPVTADQENGILYFYLDDSAVSLFEDSNHSQWLKGAVPASVLAAARAGRATDFITLPTITGPYMFRFNTLKPLGGDLLDFYQVGSPQAVDLLGVYGVGIPGTLISNEHYRLFAMIAGVFAILAVAVFGAGFALQRGFVRPLTALSKAVQHMTADDLAAKLDLHDDPIGLVTQFDSMRERLRSSYTSVTEQKTRYEAILQSIGIAVVIVDESDRIVEVNSSAERLLRQGRAELTTRKWREVLLVDEDAHEDALLSGGTRSANPARRMALLIQGSYLLRYDPRVVLHVISEPLRIGDRQVGFIHALQDASEQEEFIRAKDEFILNTAHELRGPLASLRASIESLIEEQHTLSKMELNFMLRTMQRAVIRFQSFAENLVDMGNVIAGRFMVRPSPSQLDEIVEATVGQVGSLLDVRGQALQVINNCPASCRVFADRPRVVQVLVNLLTNASKYGPEGDKILLSVSTDERYVTVEVTDHGPGIEPEEQARLFERFFRSKRALTDGSGLGLGLALAKEIVEAHGGRIEVISHIAEGSTFRFTLLKV